MRVRTVSALDARRNASVIAELVLRFLYSSVVSHTDPVQTPCAPRASEAATWRPRPMPPAPRTGTSGPTASTISGVSTMLAISPVWPPAS